MNKKNYKILLKMGWEFMVNADDENDAIDKIKKHLKHLLIQDGYFVYSSRAKESIESNEYSIEEYDGFILG